MIRKNKEDSAASVKTEVDFDYLDWKDAVKTSNKCGPTHVDTKYCMDKLKEKFKKVPQISKVRIFHNAYCKGVQIVYRDEENPDKEVTILDPIIGSNVSDCRWSELKLKQGEYLVELEGRTGAWCDQMKVITNLGRVLKCGGNGGNAYRCQFEDVAKPMIIALNFGVSGDWVHNFDASFVPTKFKKVKEDAPKDEDDLYREEPVQTDEKDIYKVHLEKYTRDLAWFIGHTAYDLIKVSAEAPKLDEKKSDKEKMEKMLMESKLLAGGMENRFINQFSSDIKKKIKDALLLVKDNTLLELIEVDAQHNDEDELLQKILQSGKDEKADELIDTLQSALQRQMPMVAHARLGGQDGMRLHRAAFAVMIKYSKSSF